MAATRIIYKRELGAYLRSPFAWVIAAVLLLVDGIFFRGFVLPGQNLSAVVLEKFFYWSSGVAMAAGLLLSFRLIAEERSSNSIVLLTTSPVRDSEIIIGKFLALLTALNLLNYVDRFVVTAVGLRIQEHLGLSDKELGFVTSAFMLGYFVTSPVFGWLGDRFPRKALIAAGVLVWSAATAASGRCNRSGCTARGRCPSASSRRRWPRRRRPACTTRTCSR